MPVFTENQLRSLSIKLLKVAGATSAQAETVTEILVDTSLFGIDSHGVRALPGHIRNLIKGRISPNGSIKILKDTQTTALWEGKGQFGHVIAKKAMETAIKKARSYRMGWVSTVSEHIGALYYYGLLAAKEGMIGIITCRTRGHRTVPYGGSEGRLGTNPLAISIPTNEEQPLLLDMATSIVASGHMQVMAVRGEKVPEGWLVDKEGNPTTDPNEYRKGGLMMPFGTYKGYGLSMIIAALPMFLPGIDDPGSPRLWGHTFMALDPEGFMPLQAFKERTDAHIRYIKSCPPLPGREILVPFEREWRTREQRSREGIPVDKPFWKDFIAVGKEIGVDVNREVSASTR